MDTRQQPIFFPDEPCSMEKAGIVFIPVPYDGTSTWGKGANHGPTALLTASEHLEGYDIETQTDVWQHGFYTDAPVTQADSPEQMSEAVYKRVQDLIGVEKYCVVLGGEHTVSIGAARAHAQAYPDLTVLQLDAHCDLRDQYHGSAYNHACVMARIREICPMVQVGIRSMDRSELALIDPERMFYAETIFGRSDWMEKVCAGLSSHIYITVDLDVFDSSVMPSTGTPEPGGLFWYDITRFLRHVCARHTVVGFDVVELCPNPADRGPDFLAAKLVYKLLSYVFAKP